MANEVSKRLVMLGQNFNKQLDASALRLYESMFRNYPEEAVCKALEECLFELRFFPTFADIKERIDRADGRPDANEAWAIVPKSEDVAVVMTQEMAIALGDARPLLNEGDSIAARMAFIEVYNREVKKARQLGYAAKWEFSAATGPGAKSTNEAALEEAQRRGRISEHEQNRLLINYGDKPKPDLSLLMLEIDKQIEQEDPGGEGKEAFFKIKAMLKGHTNRME